MSAPCTSREFAHPLARGSRAARLRVALTYRWRHGRWPDLVAPTRFTEWVQWRKLNDRDVGLARLTDKLHGKGVALTTLGERLVVPTLWQGRVLPDAPPSQFPFVVKANHGCRQCIVVRTHADWERAKRVSPRWLTKPYGRWLDEWHYGQARRSILAEPFIGEGDDFPVDYKIYVFGGRAEIIQVHEGRGSDHRWSQLDRDWRGLSRQPCGIDRPASLDRMLMAAEALAGERDFLRVDFYEVAGQPLFGEFCLFPGSGLDPFDRDDLDLLLGRKWTAAAGAIATLSSNNGWREVAVNPA